MITEREEEEKNTLSNSKVILTSLPADKSPLWCLGDTLPNRDGAWVAGVDGALLLVVAPVLVALEEVCLGHGLPAHGGVDAILRQAGAKLHQAVRVAGLSAHLFEHPVLVT